MTTLDTTAKAILVAAIGRNGLPATKEDCEAAAHDSYRMAFYLLKHGKHIGSVLAAKNGAALLGEME